jgi:mannose-6-phosphate isomerase-like protein (cupin superfamily)
MKESTTTNVDDINQRIARRVAGLRAAHALSLDALATRHNVIEQQVWVLEGAMALTHGRQTLRLEAGDCLAMRLDGPMEYRNPTRKHARYAVVVANTTRG